MARSSHSPGVGGVGKTSLAFEAAEHGGGTFRRRRIDLQFGTEWSGSAVTHAVAVALRLQQQQGLGIKESVIEYLRPRELLLVVDNSEHVVDDAARLSTGSLACPRVSLLATSREALRAYWESRSCRSNRCRSTTPPRCSPNRARASRPDFDLGHEPVGAVAEICRQLDGLPLAIELAASRMRAMSSLDVARRLDSLRLLRGGTRGAMPRQQSLAATIDWSYRLLSEPEQTMFARRRCSQAASTWTQRTVCAERTARQRTTPSIC